MFRPRALHPVGGSLPIRPAPERSSPPKLCENGRAYITDPATGQYVCLCQLDGHASHSAIPATHPALRGMRSINGSPRPGFADIQNYHSQLSAMASLGDQTTGILPPHIAFHPYGSMFAGMDVGGGPLRKAATRETTGPLKAWLGEHKKNPYPTKAEKIMLAIITKMTLTQVSTWFANARRRLKKDNRLGGGSGGGGGGGEGEEESDREGDSDCVSVSVSEDSKGLSGRTEVTLSSEGEADPDSFSDISDEESEVFRPKSCDVSTNQIQVTEAYDETVTSQVVAGKDSQSEWSGKNTNQSEWSPSKNTSRSEWSPSKNTSQSNLVVPTLSPLSSAAIEKETKPPQTKPKIWSISHILDS